MESTEPTSVSAKTSEVKGKVMDRNREEEDESIKLNQQPRTENKSKKKKLRRSTNHPRSQKRVHKPSVAATIR